MKDTYPANYGQCPFVTAQKLLQGKWSIVILHFLSGGTLRFGELQQRIPDITHATLSSQLKQLERNGIVRRVVYAEVPPRVEYSLTEIGKDFCPVLEQIAIWGNTYADYLKSKDGAREKGSPDSAQNTPSTPDGKNVQNA